MPKSSKFSKFENIKTHEKLDGFLSNANIGIQLLDKEGVIIYANEAELNLLGFTEEEYLGHNIREFHNDVVSIENLLLKLQNGESVNNHQLTLQCKDGSLKDVLINATVYFRDNQFIYSRCFTRDISSLKKAEKLLRFLNKASEELAITLDSEDALEKISKFIVPHFTDWFIIDKVKQDGETALVKMAHADEQKRKWAEKYRELNPIDLNDERQGSIGWVLRRGEPFMVSHITPEMINPKFNKPESIKLIKILSLSSVMIIPMKSNAKVTGVACFLSCTPSKIFDEADFSFAKDFTNRIGLTLENTRLYEEIKNDIEERIEVNRRKDEFISIASHELKTPVTSLKGFTQILQMTAEEKNDAGMSEMLMKMNNQVDKLTGLIIDLLDITKIDKGEMAYDMEDVDFDEFVQEIAEEMQPTTITHKIKLQLGHCPPVTGDKNRLAQVITNYISNAVKYSPGEKEIIISTSCTENDVRLCVQDFGIGVPKTEQTKLFKRFYRANGKSNQYTFPGLGLGLYICSEIINRHKGAVSVKSNGNKGSIFCFSLPRKK